jgi:hypothetical protein
MPDLGVPGLADLHIRSRCASRYQWTSPFSLSGVSTLRNIFSDLWGKTITRSGSRTRLKFISRGGYGANETRGGFTVGRCLCEKQIRRKLSEAEDA